MRSYYHIFNKSGIEHAVAQTKLHKHTTPGTMLLYILYTATNRLHVIICNDNRNNDFCAFCVDNSHRPGALYRDARQFSRLPNCTYYILYIYTIYMHNIPTK